RTCTHERERTRSRQKRSPRPYSRAAKKSNHEYGCLDENDTRQRAARRLHANHPGPRTWFGFQVSRQSPELVVRIIASLPLPHQLFLLALAGVSAALVLVPRGRSDSRG